jgi:hypothetical protein
MGLILVLEAVRTTSSEMRQLLVPLALFGILHGLHEWLEIFILQLDQLGGVLADWVVWFRLAWLAISFLILWLYGLRAFQAARQHLSPLTYFVCDAAGVCRVG